MDKKRLFITLGILMMIGGLTLAMMSTVFSLTANAQEIKSTVSFGDPRVYITLKEPIYFSVIPNGCQDVRMSWSSVKVTNAAYDSNNQVVSYSPVSGSLYTTSFTMSSWPDIPAKTTVSNPCLTTSCVEGTHYTYSRTVGADLPYKGEETYAVLSAWFTCADGPSPVRISKTASTWVHLYKTPAECTSDGCTTDKKWYECDTKTGTYITPPAITPGYCGIDCTTSSQCNSGFKCVTNKCVQDCIANNERKCYGNDVYWYDSCGTRMSMYDECNDATEVCLNAKCTLPPCSTDSECTSGRICSSGKCVAPPVQQPTAPTPTPAPADCSHNSVLCVENNVYHIDGCGKLLGVKETCGTGQVCRNSACVNTELPACKNKITPACELAIWHDYPTCAWDEQPCWANTEIQPVPTIGMPNLQMNTVNSADPCYNPETPADMVACGEQHQLGLALSPNQQFRIGVGVVISVLGLILLIMGAAL